MLVVVEVYKIENVGSIVLGWVVDVVVGDVGYLVRFDFFGREGRDEVSEDGSGDGESEFYFGGLIWVEMCCWSVGRL